MKTIRVPGKIDDKASLTIEDTFTTTKHDTTTRVVSRLYLIPSHGVPGKTDK